MKNATTTVGAIQKHNDARVTTAHLAVFEETSRWALGTETVKANSIENIEKTHDSMMANQREKLREIVEAIGISYGILVSFLYVKLFLNELPARKLPRTIDHKRKRVMTTKNCLGLFNHNPYYFCGIF